MPNGNSPREEAAQTPAPATSKRGPGREVRAVLLRVKIGPECPETNQSELIRASKPDCGISTTRKALRHPQAHHRTKGRTELAGLQTVPLQ